MNYKINIQIACEDKIPVNGKIIRHWLELTLKDHIQSGELTVRLTTMDEIKTLNATYRHQNKPTNVLAFPSQLPETIVLKYPLLGDLVICPGVLEQEHLDLNQPLIAHWAHIVIHGGLHLLGFDHMEEDEAACMQAEEIRLLAILGFDNPYHHESQMAIEQPNYEPHQTDKKINPEEDN